MTKLLNYIKSHANQSRDFLLDLIFPIECLGCGQEGVWLCKNCFKKLKLKTSQSCFCCKEENNFGEFCPECRPHHALNGIFIAGDYEDKILAKLIKSLKYHFAQDIIVILGQFLSLHLQNLINQSRVLGITNLDMTEGQIRRRLKNMATIPQPLLDKNYTLLVPVPLHKKRERWRGFNQSLGLAEEVAKNFNIKLIEKNLVRIKHKKPQAKLGERQRQENIKNCYAWAGNKLSGRPIILIDDVTTTGSTLNECARILKQNGAGEVWGLVAAKG
jgi:competence protein ComFC